LVEIAKALAIDARILVMDEPTAALDRNDAARLLDLVKRLSAEGVSVIYVSHRMPEIKAVADRVTVLKDGRTVMTASIAEAPIGRLVRAMVGRDLADFYPPRAANPPGAPALVIRGAANDHLTNIDLTVRAGEIVGVAGLEGAGKSALGRAIAGDEPFEQGTMEIAGKALTPRNPRSAIEAGIGRLSEDRKREGLLMQQSLRDNATLIQRAFASPFRAPGADTMSNAETDQRLIALDVRAANFEQEAGRLSGGNQQKVIVARWLARDPQVLVFSEPTRGIDVAAKAAIYKIMRDLADRGRAILMISSDLPEIVGVSDRIVVMREGHIAGELPGGASEEDVMAIAVAHDVHDSLGAT
jgi:ribose transport system ATP-binding protein